MNMQANKTAFRELNPQDVALVAGGDDVDGGTIVVTGTRMTDDQKLAYDMARARAENELFALGAVGAGTIGRIGGATGGVLGYAVGSALDEQTVQQLTDDLTDAYYRADGADGVYDGVSNADRAAPYGYGGPVL